VAAASRKAGHGRRGRAGGSPRSFSGSRATAGNSAGFRVEKAFFKAAPEFDAPGAVRVDLIGPGKALLSVEPPRPAEEGDPVIGAWLSFIEADIATNPGRLRPFAEEGLAALEKLVEGVVVRDDDVIPDDVTF
jgi:hypothetical protein